jgi:hypothetical protein
MTDQVTEEEKIMTDNFVYIFASGKVVVEDVYISDDKAIIGHNHIWLSPLVLFRYHQWLKTLPSLLKELI